jgi:MFS family permease
MSVTERAIEGRPMLLIARQPAFLVAVLGAAVGYAVMNLLMTATPLAMNMCHLPYSSTAFVIEWHVIGMFAPSFLTGSLVERFGVLQVMLAGTVLMFACVAIALAGVTLAHFWFALVLLGIGWNFLYVGGTTLLTECYAPSERAKAQGLNDFLVFGSMAVSSLSAGVLVTQRGWNTLNHVSLPFVTVAAASIAWLLWIRSRPPAPPVSANEAT